MTCKFFSSCHLLCFSTSIISPLHLGSPIIFDRFFFKTEWCPYCNSSKREWNNFKRYVKNLNETREEEDIITAIEIDCDSQEDICSKYNVETFPTIKIIHKNIK